MSNQIIIKPKFFTKDFFKVNLYLVSKIWYLWLALTYLAYSFFIRDFNDDDSKIPYNSIGFIIGVLLLIALIYFKNKKAIEKNPRLKEDINFIFTDDFFEEKGETFSVKHFWKDIYKIEEKQKWYLLYVQKRKAIIVRKEDLKDQLSSFKQLIAKVKIKE